MRRDIFDEDHDMFRTAFRQFVDKEIVPYTDEWEQAGITDRRMFLKAGGHGFLGMTGPEEHGGAGVDDFRFNAVTGEETQRRRVDAAGHLGCRPPHRRVPPVLPPRSAPRSRRRAGSRAAVGRAHHRRSR